MGYRDVTGPVETCPDCKAEVARGTPICPACRTPLDVWKRTELKLKLEPLRKARRFLAIVVAVGVLGLLVRSVLNGRSPAAVDVLAPVFFAACYLAAKRWPLGASIAAMSFFLFCEAYALGAGSFIALISGLIIKVFFLVLLTAGIRAGYRVRDLRGQWSKHAHVGGIAVLVASPLLGLLLGLLT